jgi:hypothetical protein
LSSEEREILGKQVETCQKLLYPGSASINPTTGVEGLRSYPTVGVGYIPVLRKKHNFFGHPIVVCVLPQRPDFPSPLARSWLDPTFVISTILKDTLPNYHSESTETEPFHH